MLYFGVAGYPLGFTKNHSNSKRYQIFKWLNDLNLDVLEVQMTYGPRMKKEKCKRYKKLADEFGIRLSIHGAYYVVLTSSEKKKVDQSIETLKKTFELADILDTKIVNIHPGSMYGEGPEDPTKRLIQNIRRFFDEVGK